MQKVTAVSALLLLALAGCQTPAPVEQPKPAPVEAPPPKPAPAPLPPPPPPVKVPTAGERALAQGVALYDAGDFNGAIKELLGAKEIWDDTTTPGANATKLAALKYLAFSYCVTNRRTQCRQQFADAIKLDSGFALEPAEKTHPIWGPEFDRAKAMANAPAAPARRAAPPAAPPAPAPTPPKTQ